MNELLTVSARGQVTLPATLRRRLGLRGGDVLVPESQGEHIVLRPQTAFDRYDDDQIEQWDVEDRLDGDERRRIIEALTQSDLDPPQLIDFSNS